MIFRCGRCRTQRLVPYPKPRKLCRRCACRLDAAISAARFEEDAKSHMDSICREGGRQFVFCKP
jgi:hypothetical protein